MYVYYQADTNGSCPFVFKENYSSRLETIKYNVQKLEQP